MNEKLHTPLCDCMPCEAIRIAAAERRGFIKGLEAARRIAGRKRSEFRKLGTNRNAAVVAAITARIKREKAKHDT